MEEKTITYPNGVKHVFKMVRDKAMFTSHIWVYKDGVTYLHITPKKEEPNWCNVAKNIEGFGFMSMGDICRQFVEITIANVCRL